MVSGFSAPPVARAAPSAFGFQVRCQQSLRFLRSGGGVETLEVVTAPEPRKRPQVAPVADWTLAGACQEARGTLYHVDRGVEFWGTRARVDHIDPAPLPNQISDRDEEN